MAGYTADRNLWLNADRTKVVEDGDPEAAYLLASAGKEVDAATAEKYGLGAKPRAKAAEPAEDKQVAGPPEDKAAAPKAKKGRK